MHSDPVTWAIFKAAAAIAIVFIVLMLLADILWIACPRLMEPLLRQGAWEVCSADRNA
jgi:hypothetical protein